MLKTQKAIFKTVSVFYILFLLKINIFAEDFKDSIIPKVESIGGNVDTDSTWWNNIIDSILEFVQESIFSLLAVIAIWAFLYIGLMFVKADWNPEEMKKAFMSLMHVTIGLFIVAASWVIVKMVSGINF